MKLSQRSVCKRAISIALGLLVLTLVISSISSASASSTEYVYLTSRGNSMYPTMVDGDRVKVQICTNGSLINNGDVIAYCTIATGTNPGYMWIGHRVVEKYNQDDTWYFKTKGDNNPESDRWEVPEYWLLGMVVDVDHNGPSSETSSQTERPQTKYPYTSYPKELFSEGLQTLLLTLGSIGLGASIAAFNNLRRRKQLNILKKANIYSCYSCRHCEIQYTYRLVRINGRIGIRKNQDFSKGFCKYHNFGIEDFPRRNCKQYRAKYTHKTWHT